MNPTQEPNDRQPPTTLEAALAYAARGWSMIPIKPGTKKPACRSWTPYQTTPADEKTLRCWFGKNPSLGLAVVLGPVSGGLVCRDFDDIEAYEAWSREHPPGRRVADRGHRTGPPRLLSYFGAAPHLR